VGRLSPEMGASSDEAGSHRKTDCAGHTNAGERMLAGGGCVVGGRTPAKPPWPEEMIFWEFSSGGKAVAGDGSQLR
jgi:hypothetical protein